MSWYPQACVVVAIVGVALEAVLAGSVVAEWVEAQP